MHIFQSKVEFTSSNWNLVLQLSVVNFMEDYSSEINNLIYVDRDIEDAKWEKIGREIAKNEGRLEEKQEMVEKLLNLDVDINTISQASGLSVDEVLKIKESLE